ncbi:uncharacterized protein [Clytia hemisphaerica]|uniref:Cnidarian restricted protein n=1 Tax=Clytia hemisphaerica TaxID=252671 RepID=A0A7M5UYN1_9CNID
MKSMILLVTLLALTLAKPSSFNFKAIEDINQEDVPGSMDDALSKRSTQIFQHWQACTKNKLQFCRKPYIYCQVRYPSGYFNNVQCYKAGYSIRCNTNAQILCCDFKCKQTTNMYY